MDLEKENKNNTSLVFSHFSKKYSTSKNYSVRDVSLEIEGGTIFGFIGPNGAGKSTCIKSIIGLLPITEGNITVCGYDVKKKSVLAKKEIGYVPDHYVLYEKLTGEQYINYLAKIYDVDEIEKNIRVTKYLKLFKLTDAYKNKIETYSHGMKQKITIIGSLIHSPKLWILDEPLTGLDPTSIYEVKECMREYAKEGNIVFFSSHLIEVVEKLCTHIGLIKDGQLIYHDKIDGTKNLEAMFLELIGAKANE